jgi:hypothetical protein
MFIVSKGHTGEMFLTLWRTGTTRILYFKLIWIDEMQIITESRIVQ